MTAPKVNTIRRGDSRFYVSPENGSKVPGVTSIVGMLPKPFLTRWSAKSVAEFAVDNLGAVQSLVDNGVSEAAVNLLKDAPWRDTRQAARTGDAAHDAMERMANGESLASVLASIADPKERATLEPFAVHYDEFLQEFQPEFLFTEETVWSDTHGYAGSFDALAVIQGERVWLDNKTTRSGVHSEVALQLSAYANADFILRGDGTRVPLPKATKGAVVHMRPEGWSLVPVRIEDDVFQMFLHLRQVFEWDKDVQNTVLGKPINANPSLTATGRQTAAAKRKAATLAADA